MNLTYSSKKKKKKYQLEFGRDKLILKATRKKKVLWISKTILEKKEQNEKGIFPTQKSDMQSPVMWTVCSGEESDPDTNPVIYMERGLC